MFEDKLKRVLLLADKAPEDGESSLTDGEILCEVDERAYGCKIWTKDIWNILHGYAKQKETPKKALICQIEAAICRWAQAHIAAAELNGGGASSSAAPIATAAMTPLNVSVRAAAVATPRAGLTETIDTIPLSLSKSKRKRATDAGPSRAESIEQVEASELLPNEGIPEPAVPSNARPPRPRVGMFCAICLDAPCTMMVVPCGHKCLCEGCKKSLEAQGRSSRSGKVHEAVSPPCPICLGSIQQIIKVIEAGSD